LIEVNVPPYAASYKDAEPIDEDHVMRRLSDIIYHQHPLTLRPSASVKDACQHMRTHGTGSILVTDEAGRLAGIFTGRDAVCRVLAAGKDAETTKLSDVMTTAPTTMSPDKSAIDALRMMWDGGFRHIPVVKNGELIGVVSRGDFKGHEEDRLEEERDLWEHMR
jgi:CBS domain-containing protein